MYLQPNQQLLIYIKGKDRVRKSRVIKAMEMGFALLERKNELGISAPTSSATNENSGSTVDIAIGVNTRVEKTHKVKVNAQWSYYSFLIVDKVNMTNLKLVTSID